MALEIARRDGRVTRTALAAAAGGSGLGSGRLRTRSEQNAI
jgi:hypothetical protein